MFSDSKLVAFAATADPIKARRFYESVLGLQLVSENPFAIVFDANGVTLRIQVVQLLTLSNYTTLGWEVDHIENMAENLATAGVSLERFPGMEHDSLGIWTSPDGSKIGWFKDPDGNLISISQRQS